MTTTTSKRGRKNAQYHPSWGGTIVGLTKLESDGRWKISGPPSIKFTEKDEHRAVARFYEWQGQQQQTQTISIPVAVAPVNDSREVADVMNFLSPPVADTRTPKQTVDDFFVPAPVPAGKAEFGTTIKLSDDGTMMEWHGSHKTQAAAFWATMRKLVLEQSKLCARMTGIEQLGYLSDLPKPKPSPTLEEVGTLYSNKAGLSSNEVSRSKLFWAEFSKAVGMRTVREIDHNHVASYEKYITSKTYSPKSILHRYCKIRTILAYAIKRGVGLEDCRRVLDCTAMLEVKKHNAMDPRPIDPHTFWKIHEKAVGAGDDVFAALMVTSLNAAMYAGEASDLKWSEINLNTKWLATDRPKTGVARVAMLWPETIRAIKALPKDREHVFNTSVRSYTVFSVLAKWRTYREAAGFGEETTFGAIRDAAFTIACRVSVDQAKQLAGHRFAGSTDNYLKRYAPAVTEACKAIHDEFFNRKNKKARS